MLVQRRTTPVLLLVVLAIAGCGRSLSTDAASARIAQAEDAVADDDRPATAGGGSAPDGAREAGGSGGAGAVRDSSASGGGQGGGVAGAPFGPSGRRAAGAPVHIPAFTIAGTVFAEQRQFVVDEIITACGDGTQCVGIAVSVEDASSDGDPDNDGFEPCAVLAETPQQTVARGATITFRVAAPCGDDGAPAPEGAEREPDGQGPASEEAAGPDTTTPDEPAGTTDSTSDEGGASQEQAGPSAGDAGRDAGDAQPAAGTSEGGADVGG